MDFNKSDLKRYGVLIFGLTMAAGFTFGGMASMSAMVQTPSDSGDNNNLEDAELPGSHYSEEPFDLTDNQKLYLAASQSKVFVTGYYSNDSQKEMLSGLQQLEESFGDALYVELSDEDSGTILDQTGVTDYPAIIVNGGVTREGSMRVQSIEDVQEVDTEQVSDLVCETISSYPNDETKTTCV